MQQWKTESQRREKINGHWWKSERAKKRIENIDLIFNIIKRSEFEKKFNTIDASFEVQFADTKLTQNRGLWM